MQIYSFDFGFYSLIFSDFPSVFGHVIHGTAEIRGILYLIVMVLYRQVAEIKGNGNRIAVLQHKGQRVIRIGGDFIRFIHDDNLLQTGDEVVENLRIVNGEPLCAGLFRLKYST